MTKEEFSAVLVDSIRHRYGRLIPSTKLAQEIDLISNGEVSLSGEAVRKWLRGKSVPNGYALFALDVLLGDYFIHRRKLKKLRNPFTQTIEEMTVNELIEVQQLIKFRIEKSRSSNKSN